MTRLERTYAHLKTEERKRLNRQLTEAERWLLRGLAEEIESEQQCVMPCSRCGNDFVSWVPGRDLCNYCYKRKPNPFRFKRTEPKWTACAAYVDQHGWVRRCRRKATETGYCEEHSPTNKEGKK